jgi:hypothetical protein
VELEALARLLEVLRTANVREAHFHADGQPARLVFGQPDVPAASRSGDDGDDSKDKPGGKDPRLAHSRMRPKAVP